MGANFTYPDPDPIDLPLGSVVEWGFNHQQFHPVHVHVNPFQLMDLPESSLNANTTYTSWFQVRVARVGVSSQCAAYRPAC